MNVVAEPFVTSQDVTTIMRLLGDIAQDVSDIRYVLVEDDGEEEEGSEADS